MKKEDLKNVYDEIKISSSEKAKIFNNIMEKKNKKINWLPVIGFGLVALASVGLFMILSDVNTKNSSFNSLSLETNYSKEIIINSKEYLEANNIDLTILGDGEVKSIDATKIVTDEKYSMCEGSLKITRYSNDYSYATDVKCSNSSNGKKVEFKLYEGDLINVFEISDGIVTVSQTDKTYKSYEDGNELLVGANITITFFDYEGNVKWSTLYNETNTEEDPTIITLEAIQKMGDKYLVFTKNEYNFQYYTENQNSSSSCYYDILVFDESGKLVSKREMEYRIIFLGGYLGEDDGKYYYDVEVGELGQAVLEITNDNLNFYPYECFVSEENSEVVITRNPMVVKDGYVYGYISKKSFDEKEFYEANIIYKMSLDGTLVFEEKIEYDVNLIYIHELVVMDNYIYVSVFDEFLDEKLVLKYDNKMNFNSLVSFDIKSDNLVVRDIQLDKNNNLNINLYDEDNQYLVVINNEDKLVSSKEISLKDVADNFEYSYLSKSVVIKDKLLQVYSVSERLEDQILLAFYE